MTLLDLIINQHILAFEIIEGGTRQSSIVDSLEAPRRTVRDGLVRLEESGLIVRDAGRALPPDRRDWRDGQRDVRKRFPAGRPDVRSLHGLPRGTRALNAIPALVSAAPRPRYLAAQGRTEERMQPRLHFSRRIGGPLNKRISPPSRGTAMPLRIRLALAIQGRAGQPQLAARPADPRSALASSASMASKTRSWTSPGSRSQSP